MGAMLVRQAPASAAVVRREIATDLELRGVGTDCVDDVSLVASELVGNAVQHATLTGSDDLDVSWTIADHDVFICVSDSSEDLPRLRVAADVDTCGRGLAIIQTLSSDWGVEPTAFGKRVWAKVPFVRAS